MNYKNIDYIRSKELETDKFVDTTRMEKIKLEESMNQIEQPISRRGIVNGAIMSAIIIGLGIIIAIAIVLNN